MKFIHRITSILIVFFIINQLNAQSISNKGRDFWVAYGYHQYMGLGANPPNDQNMTIYLSVEDLPAGKAYATVTVEADSSDPNPSLWWRRTYRIPANTVISTDNTPAFSFNPASALGNGPVPKGATDAAQSGTPPTWDFRLFNANSCPNPVNPLGFGYFRGKGLHITSDVDIVAYAHIYGGVSSGATMLLPTSSWGYSYTSLNSAQNNVTDAGSFFFIVAQEDSTVVKITPSQIPLQIPCVSATPQVPYTVTLHKGWIYQYRGFFDNGTQNGVDLTGSKIESIPNQVGKCKKIAVFSGSGRTGGESLVCGFGGRDNDMQQCFPEHTWGNIYLTAPFATDGNPVNACGQAGTIYKVVAKDTGTIVTITSNAGVTTQALPNFGFVRFHSAGPCKIEGNKPIAVAQYMAGSNCGNGDGDPEMIYLSPVEQAISRVNFYRQTKEAINSNFVSIIIPDSGLSSLRIDGQLRGTNNFGPNGCVRPHPHYPGHSIVVKGWASASTQVIVSCDNARFTCITYGMGGAESYGYSGGTYLNNLSGLPKHKNIEDTVSNKQNSWGFDYPYIFNGSKLDFIANMAYPPRKIDWLFGDMFNNPKFLDQTKLKFYKVCGNDTFTPVNVTDTLRGYLYTPPYKYVGKDTFYVKGCNASGSCVSDMHIVSIGCAFSANTTPAYISRASGIPPYTGNVGTDMSPSCGTTPYVYTIVNTFGRDTTRSTQGGVVTLNIGNGALQYIPRVPAATFNGKDTLYIRICDNNRIPPFSCFVKPYYFTIGTPFSADTVVIKNATSDIAPLTGNAALELNPVGGRTPYTYSIVGSPTTVGATVTIAGSNYTYNPVAGFTGVDSFYVRVCDANTPTNSCIIQKHVVNINAPFSANTNNILNATTLNSSYNEASSININPSGGNNGKFIYSIVNASGANATTSNKGCAIIIKSNNGLLTYTPTTGLTGIDTFYIKVCDGNTTPNCATQMYVVNINPTLVGTTSNITHNVNNASSVGGDASVEISATGGTPTYSYDVVNQFFNNVGNLSSRGGSVSVNPSTGVYSYTPQSGYIGSDTFYIRLQDASTTKRRLVQMHIVSVYPFIIGNRSPIFHTIAGDRTLSGNLWQEMSSLDSISTTTYIPTNALGAYFDSSSRKGLVAMIPLPKDTLFDAIKGNRYYYNSLPSPHCNYVFEKINPNSITIDSVFVPLVVYSKPKNFLPAGCFGEGGLVGDTLNFNYYIFPRVPFETKVNIPTCPSDSSIMFFLPDSSQNFSIGSKNYKLKTIRWVLKINGTFRGNPVFYYDSIVHKNQTNQTRTYDFDKGSTINATWILTFSDGSRNVTDQNFIFNSTKLKLVVIPKKVCINNPTIKVFDSTETTAGLTSNVFDMGDGLGPINKPTTPFFSFNHTYTAPGTYIIKHDISINGCNAAIPSAYDTVVVSNKINPVIVYPQDCIDTSGKATFYFDSTKHNVPVRIFNWKFGDPASGASDSSSINPTFHFYPKEDSFNIKLFVKDTTGCEGDTTIRIPIHIKPNIIFNAIAREYCNNEPPSSIANYAACLNFNRVGGKGIFKGNGIDTNGIFNPRLVSPGTHSIWYIYTSSSGLCIDSLMQTIIVNDTPKVDFSVTSGCLPKSGVAQFDNLTTNGFLFRWDFDDAANTFYTNNPTIVDSTRPTHRYYNTGTYNVKLYSETFKGCKDSIVKSLTFSVTPQAVFPKLDSVCESQSAIAVNKAFTSNGVASSSILGNYYGNGVSLLGQLSPAVSGYGNTTVTYIATLQGTTCADTAQSNIYIKAKPIVGYSYPVGCLPPSGLVQFIDTSKMPDNQSILSCTWNFGDPASGAANTASTCNASHTYSYGTYIVYHSVTSSLGCTSDRTDTITFSISPSLQYTAIPSVCETDTAHSIKYGSCLNAALVPGTGIYRGLGVIDSVNGIINPRLLGEGTFTMYFVYTATSGCVRIDSQTVVIKGGPRGTFSFTPNGCLNASGNVQFSSAGIRVTGSTISQYNWDFGAAGTSSISNPSINFSDGTYTISLSVLAANGCRYDTSMQQSFSRIPSLAALDQNDTCENVSPFSIRPATVLNGVLGTYSYSSFKNAVNTVTGLYDPSIAGAGIDTIYCTYTTAAGCSTTVSKAIRIFARPRGIISYTPFKQCLNTTGSIEFDATGIVAQGDVINSYAWTFNNTTTGISFNGSIVKPQAAFEDGVYNIRLITTSGFGCSFDTTITDTFSKTPSLEPIVQAAICTNGGTVQLTKPNVLNNVNGNGVFTSFKNAINPAGSLTYDPDISGYGFDTLYYTFTSNGGCVSVEKLAVEVKSRPTGTFTYTPSAGICLDTTGKVVFDASNITAPGYSIASYNWDFGKGRTDVGVNPTVFFDEGTDTIKLRVYGTNNCWFDTSLIATFGKTANISPFSIDAICSNGTVVPIPTPSILNNVNGTGVFTSFKGAVVPVNQYNPTIAGSGKDTLYYSFTSNGGCPATQKFVVEVKSRPTGNFTFSPNGICLDTAGTVNFTANYTTIDTSTVSGYVWNFGNSNSGSGVSPISYYNEGTYIIRLRINSSNGCFTEDSVTTTFKKTPAIALLDTINPCENSTIRTILQPAITNNVNTTGVFSSFKNAISQIGAYTPSIAGNGIDTIYFTATSNGGCVAVQKQAIEIKAIPTGNFTFSPRGTCLDVLGTVNFIANYTIPNSTTISKYEWDFGNNTSLGNGINTTSFYNESNYTIKLKVEAANNCFIVDSINTTFTKTPDISAIDTINPCENGVTRLINQPTITNSVAGNGVFSSFKNAISSAGVYTPSIAGYGVDTIYYTYTSLGGCSNVQKQAIIVKARPYGTFTFTPQNGCLDVNGRVQFNSSINVPNSSVQTYTWNFGDQSPVRNGASVAHNYNQDGQYTITLNALGVNGCMSDTSLTSTFNRTPQLGNFVYNNPVCNNHLPFNFIPPNVLNSVTGTGVFTSTKGAITNAVAGLYDPSIAGFGRDTITYTYTSAAGNCIATRVLILNVLAAPTGSFSFTPNNGCLDVSGTVRFSSSNIRVSGSFPTTFEWDFGNGVGTGANPTRNYLDGTYDIKLKVTGNNTCTNNFEILNQQFSRTPLLNPIVIDNAICGNTNAFLLNPPSVSNGVNGPNGVFTSFRNNVTGNNVTGYLYNPSIANYITDTVYYRFVSFAGCSTIVKKPITINPVPVVKLKYPTNICLNDSSLLRDVSTIIYGSIDSTFWAINDTTIVNPTDRMLWNTFDTVGYFGVKLTTKSDSGCVASDSFTISVRPNPTALFVHTNIVCMPNGSVYFNNLSTIDPFGGTLKYKWNFEDFSNNISAQNDSVSTLSNPRHTYSSVSNYAVKLTAISKEFGCKDEFIDTLKVNEPFYQKPIANFFVSKDTLCQDEFVTFIDTASIAPGSSLFSWTWNYGDGTVPNTTIVPTSTYAYPNIVNNFRYNASLVVRSKELCESDPFTKTITIYPRPRIDSMQPIFAIDGSIIQLKPKVSDSVSTGFTWTGNAPYFTNGFSNDDTLSPYVQISLANALGTQSQGVTNAPVVYQLVAKGRFNCTDTAYQVVKILGRINIPNSFSPNGDGINDRWDISSIGDYPNAKIEIFDRYGNKLVSLSGSNLRWDGTINGTPAPVATYYYIISPGNNMSPISGWVMLFR